jgi:2-dehydro-3-deoxygluconokinase
MPDAAARDLDVVTFGETMVLLVAEPGLPLDDATAYRRSIAGSESNVALALARQGHRAGWFGRVGDDPFGGIVLRTVRGEGVDTSRVRTDPDAPTGLLVRDSHSERPIEVLYFRRGSAGSRLSPADVDPGYVGSARILHFSGITPVLSDSAHEASLAALDAARAAGTTVTFDPNIRRRLCPPDRVGEVLRPFAGADVILAGADEAELLSGAAEPVQAAGWFLDQGARIVVIKHSANGCWATDGTHTWKQDPVRVRSVDPVGAGDAFAAGFLSAMLTDSPSLDDIDVAGALARAAALGAAAVQTVGDVEGVPRGAAGTHDPTIDVRR